MKLTDEQHSIVEHLKTSSSTLPTLVNSVAGSGKTSLLTAIANALQPKKALYLAYNKSIATEAKHRFPSTVLCSTIHSFAYASTVKPYKLTLGTLTYRDLPSSLSYDEKLEILESLRQYFLSAYTSLETFASDENLPKHYLEVMTSLTTAMESGDSPCTHDFYLKFFHLLLHGNHVEFHDFDFIALDEAGDINPVTLEIVKLLPAKKKILVGDSRQNIYSFNHTINCFSQVTGNNFSMSKSFRVSPAIAASIQTFCHEYIDPAMSFIGTPQNDSIISKAYIARTNAMLIGKMMELNEYNIPYTLVRSADDIFRLPRALCSLSRTTKYITPEFKFLLDDVKDFYSNPDLIYTHKSLHSYLLHIYKDDPAISNTLKLINRYKTQGILNCYEEAKKHERTDTQLLLGSAHSFKGLEVDEVTIAEDLNASVSTVMARMAVLNLTYDQLLPEEQSELNLYYVACTRARKVLNNATQLHITKSQILKAIPNFDG